MSVTAKKDKVLFIVNDSAFFLSHRLPIAIAAIEAGYEVHVATAPGPASEKISSHGIFFHPLDLTRSGRNPLSEIKSFLGILKLLRTVRPTVAHLVTIKPVLYGGIACRLSKVPGVVSAISGLGATFIKKGIKASLSRIPIKLLYRMALGHRNLKVIFQNPDDRGLLLRLNALHETQAVLIRGSGVDIARYQVVPEPRSPLVVTMASRLLWDKGVREYIEACRQLRKLGYNVDFWLAGDIDTGNPATVSKAELTAWQEEGTVKVLGYCTNVADLFSRSNVVVLPSYREGLPKVLIEAAACGRSVVTTDTPGCRDAITPGETGILVPVRDSHSLAAAIESLIRDSKYRERLGRNGRLLAEKEFAIEQVVQTHLNLYAELSG